MRDRFELFEPEKSWERNVAADAKGQRPLLLSCGGTVKRTLVLGGAVFRFYREFVFIIAECETRFMQS